MHTGKHMPFHMQKFVDVKMLCYLQVPLATNIAQAGAKEAVAIAAAAKELFKADPRICSPSNGKYAIRCGYGYLNLRSAPPSSILALLVEVNLLSCHIEICLQCR